MNMSGKGNNSSVNIQLSKVRNKHWILNNLYSCFNNL